MEPVLEMQSVGLTNSRVERIIRMLWRLTVVIAIVPMAVGFSITALYWLTRWEWCIAAGLWWLLIGGGLVAAGFCLFAVCAIHEWQHKRRGFRKIRFAILLASQFMNIGAAVVCISVGSSLAEQLSVIVVNKSGAPIDSCVIDGFGFHAVHTSIMPDRTTLDTFRPGSGNDLEAIITQKGRAQHLMLGHDTDDTGTLLRVEIRPDGSSTIERGAAD